MKRYISTLILAAWGAAAIAQSPFQALISSVITANGEVNAAIASNQAALASARADNALPGLEVDFEHLWGENGSPNRYSAGISQEFEMPWVYSARRSAIDAQARAVDYAKAAIWADKALAVKLLIIDIINARQRLDFYLEIGRNLAAVDSLTQRSFHLGNATVLDVRKAQLSILENDRAVDACRADLAALQASLRAQGASFSGNEPCWSDYPIQSLQAASTNPDDYYQYHLGRLNAEAARQQAKAVGRQNWPSLTVGYRYSNEDRTNFHGFSIALRLPSFSQRQRRLAADLEAQAIASQYDFELAQAMAEASGQAQAASALNRSLQRYEALNSDASYPQLLHRAFIGGELSVIDYLNEMNIYRATYLNYLDLKYQFALTLARLNRYRSIDFN